MNKKIILVCATLFIFLLLNISTFAVSSPITVDSEVIKDKILSNETAEYNIYIENIKDQTDTIRIDHDFLKWQVIADPYIITIPPHKTVTSKIRISPPADIKSGAYSLTLKFHSSNYPQIIKKYTLVLTVTKNVGIPPVKLSLNMPSEVEPGESNFTLETINNLGETQKNLTVILNSELFPKQYIYSLGDLNSNEEKNISGEFDILPKSPGEYTINIEVKQGKDTISSENKKIELLEGSEVSLEKRVEKSFLKTKYIILIKNKGNSEVKKELKATFGSFEKHFVKSEPKPTVMNRIKGGEEFFWIYTLGPNETTSISYTISYQLLFTVIILLIILGIIAYIYLREEISIKKKVLLTKKHEGGKYIKIMIQLKNNSRKTINNLKLVDWVKTPLILVEKFDTIHPQLIKKKEDKIKIIWNIDKLDPKEEKVIAYGTKSKLEILGDLELPKAAAYYHKKGKLKEFWSNSPFVHGKE